jgi:hypothetical protein
MNDGGEWHHPPGDAKRRSRWTDARVSALGKSSILYENDYATLTGHCPGQVFTRFSAAGDKDIESFDLRHVLTSLLI